MFVAWMEERLGLGRSRKSTCGMDGLDWSEAGGAVRTGTSERWLLLPPAFLYYPHPTRPFSVLSITTFWMLDGLGNVEGNAPLQNPFMSFLFVGMEEGV